MSISNEIDTTSHFYTELEKKSDVPIYTDPVKKVCYELQDRTVTAKKNEHAIVGDAFFATVNQEDTPEWLLTLVDNVVSTSIESNLTNYDQLIESVRSAIDALDVAQNTYVEQININQIVNGIVSTRLATLNATYENTYATIVNLNASVATTQQAYTQLIQDSVASLNDTVNARITNVELAYTDADTALASSISALTASLVDQTTELEGTASSILSLQNYVGLTASNTPDGTGILARLSAVENQNDGTLTYHTGQYDVMIGVTREDTDVSDNELDVTQEPYATWIATDNTNGNDSVRASKIGDVFIQYAANGDYVKAYKFIKTAQDLTDPFATDADGYTWSLITDTDSNNAYIAALEAQGAADGKISHFYAWGGVNAPADYIRNPTAPANEQETVSASNFYYWFKSNNKLYYKPSGTWIEVPKTKTSEVYIDEGDLLDVFNPVTGDISKYSYNGVTWQLNGPNGIISKSNFLVALDNEVRSPNGLVAQGLANLSINNRAYTDGQVATVKNSFLYESTIRIGDKYYTSAFGLDASGITQTTDGNTAETAYSSEFWVNAQKVVFKHPDNPAIEARFNVTSSGIQLSAENTEATRNVPRGTYSNSTNYVTGDIVSYNGGSYTALQNSQNRTPSAHPSYWQVLAEQGPQGTGQAGPRGAGTFYVGTTTGIWSDSVANNAVTNDVPVTGDIVNIFKTSDPSVGETKKYNGSIWEGFTLVVNGNVLATGSIDGEAIRANSRIISPDIYLIGTTTMIVLTSTPFGPDRLLEWKGPINASTLVNGLPNLNALRKSNATVSYLADDGDTYFGGTLSAGILKNAARTSVVTLNPAIEVGPFGTNGNTKTVVVSIAMDAYYEEPAGSNQSQPSNFPPTTITIRLERRLGLGSWQTLQTVNVTGATTVLDLYGNEAGTSPWQTEETMYYSFTFTDNESSTSNFTYRAVGVGQIRYHLQQFITRQELSLISTEE